jgi:hypothetical protein
MSTAYDTLDKFARYAARRKAVIYVSSGYASTLYQTAARR